VARFDESWNRLKSADIVQFLERGKIYYDLTRMRVQDR